MSGIGLCLGNYLAFTHRPSLRFEALEALAQNNRLFKDVCVVSKQRKSLSQRICFSRRKYVTKHKETYKAAQVEKVKR